MSTGEKEMPPKGTKRGPDGVYRAGDAPPAKTVDRDGIVDDGAQCAPVICARQ